MRATIGAKLGLGFSVVIGLMVTSAVLAHLRLAEMDECAERILRVSVPAVKSCDAIRNAVNRSAAAVRGFAILVDDDPGRAAQFQRDMTESWTEIDRQLANLRSLHNSRSGWMNESALNSADAALRAFREAQKSVVEGAAEQGSSSLPEALHQDALSLAEQLLASLDSAQARGVEPEATPEGQKVFRMVRDLHSEAARAVAALRQYVERPDKEKGEAFASRWSAVEEAATAIESQRSQSSIALGGDWEPTAALLKQLGALAYRLTARGRPQDAASLEQLVSTQVLPRRARVDVELARLQEAADALLAESRTQWLGANATTKSTLLLATLLAAALAAVVAATLSRRIARSLQQIMAAAQRIAGGDLSGQPLKVSAGDEIAALAASFETMRSGLRELAGQLLCAVENVTSSTSEIVASTRQQASATREQATSVQEITTTMKEISEAGGQIEDRARRVSGDAESASAVMDEGTQAAQDANHSMDGVRQQVEEVAENIVGLSGRTQAIGELVATVTDIAEQSNLLALNASIEAVAAGEHGARFSVVANEMKNLADQAKACTVQVRTILGEIQKGIHSSVMLTEEAVKRVEKGKGQTETTEVTIRRMADTTEACVQAFQQILGGSNQQQVGVTQVAQGMEGIRQAVEQTAAGTSQLEKAASNLSALSNQLESVARRYQT